MRACRRDFDSRAGLHVTVAFTPVRDALRLPNTRHAPSYTARQRDNRTGLPKVCIVDGSAVGIDQHLHCAQMPAIATATSRTLQPACAIFDARLPT